MLDLNLDDFFQLALDEADNDQREAHVIEILKRYLSLCPKNSRAWLTYGECLRIVGRFEESMNALLSSLDLAPDKKKPIIMGRIGFLCTVFQSPQEAEVWYRLGAKNKYCSDGWIWLFRGINLVKLGKYSEAIHCFDESSEYDDVDDSEVSLNKGIVFRAMEKYDEARQSFKAALNKDENYEDAKRCYKGLKDIKITLKILENLKV